MIVEEYLAVFDYDKVIRTALDILSDNSLSFFRTSALSRKIIETEFTFLSFRAMKGAERRLYDVLINLVSKKLIHFLLVLKFKGYIEKFGTRSWKIIKRLPGKNDIERREIITLSKKGNLRKMLIDRALAQEIKDKSRE